MDVIDTEWTNTFIYVTVSGADDDDAAAQFAAEHVEDAHYLIDSVSVGDDRYVVTYMRH